MASALSQKSWGYVVTCTGGTSVPNVLVPAGTRIAVSAIVCGGAATTDITLVQDSGLTTVFSGAAVVNTMDKFVPAQPILMDGLAVGFAGATTGYCNIFLAK